MWNKLYLIYRMIKRENVADRSLVKLLLEQYEYGSYNYEYMKECKSFINRCIRQYNLDIAPITD